MYVAEFLSKNTTGSLGSIPRSGSTLLCYDLGRIAGTLLLEGLA